MATTAISALAGRDLIGGEDLTKAEINCILDLATTLKAAPQPALLSGLVMGSCFLEPSTRTRLSFEGAICRMGGQSIGFAESGTTSCSKGESLWDMMKMMDAYVDLIVIRHPQDGAATLAAEAASVPVINAGDGSNQHPTQALLDLLTIRECQGRLDELRIAMVGDLRYGRTVHSLALLASHYRPRLFFVSPNTLEMPEEICTVLRERGIRFSLHHTIEEIIGKTDILYMTRIQQERFANRSAYETVKDHFILSRNTLKSAPDHLKVLHPLPRLNEIPKEVDGTPHAHYFQQAANGLYARQALLALLLGKTENM